MSHKKLLKIPDHWQDFVVCILLHMLLPLLPLLIEVIHTGDIGDISVTLAASMYAISIGVSSHSKIQFGMGILTSIFFAISYGLAIGNLSPDNSLKSYALWAIGGIFVFHAIERYNMHVVDRTPFFKFM